MEDPHSVIEALICAKQVQVYFRMYNM
jgi:hypothetical protein